MTRTTPQPDPADVLTDAERLDVQRATECLTAHHAARGANDLSLVRNPIEQAVERIIAARTTDAAARLAAVEALVEDAEAYDEHGDATIEVTVLRAVLSTTAPDEGGDCQDDCTVHATCRTTPDAGPECPSDWCPRHGFGVNDRVGDPCYARLTCPAPDAGHLTDMETLLSGVNGRPEMPTVTQTRTAPDAGQREESCGDCGHLASRHWLPGGCHGTQGTISRACRCARNSA